MRYPGAPNDTGTMHPIVAAVMSSGMGAAVACLQSLAAVGMMVQEMNEQADAVPEDAEPDLTMVPAYDRLTDLAVLGLLVEGNKIHTTSSAMAGLAMEPCENYTGKSTCMDEGSGRTHDAQYGADRYCWPCRIRHAIGGHLVAAEGR